MQATELLDRCASLVATVTDAAPDGERDRRVPQRVVDAARDAGLFRAIVPTSLGGSGFGVDVLANCTRILAHGCPATAWTLSFLALHAWLLSKLPAAGRAEVFAAGPSPFAPAPLAPTGRAVPAAGGFVVHGRWEWATAVAHADWVMVHALEDGPRIASRFVVLPIDEVEIDDVWFTSGMRATGSNTVRVDGRFVPAHRTVPAPDLLDARTTLDGDGLAGLPVASVLALVAAAPALGAAEAATNLFRERLATRVLAYSLGDKAAEQPAAQVRLATVLDAVRTASARWNGALARLAGGNPLSQADRVDVRLAAASVVRTARRAIGLVCEGAGASVYFESHPLQRLQRDVETLKGHVIFDWDRTAELAGRHALGFGLRPTDLV
jgi:alkylation response protein AidB-like acyl-CoA dehydrogenase